eukprot:2601025-Rhodomonas_salina.1
MAAAIPLASLPRNTGMRQSCVGMEHWQREAERERERENREGDGRAEDRGKGADGGRVGAGGAHAMHASSEMK